MKKFCVKEWLENAVKEVQCQRETESCVWIDGRRTQKMSGYAKYFDSFADAKGYLVASAESRIACMRTDLDRAEASLELAKALEPSSGLGIER